MTILHNVLFDGWDDATLESVSELSIESEEEELERVFYYQLESLDSLESIADAILDMHQVEYFIMKNGKRIGIQRTRETVNHKEGGVLGGDNQVELTFKIFKGAAGATEYTATVNKDIVSAMTAVGDRVITKRRYIVDTDVAGLKWEIDVPFEGTYDNWVKVDLEVPSMETDLPEFPLNYVRKFEVTHGVEVSDEDKVILDKIFNNKQKEVKDAVSK